MPDPHAFCGYCGHAMPSGARTWPRVCADCGNATFLNPLPVAVVLQPVRLDDGRLGLLTIRRGIEPARGLLALPGGYVDHGEDWRAAASRELMEEAHVALPDPLHALTIFDALSNPQGDRILIFGQAPILGLRELPPFSPTDETTERLVISEPQTMAFSLHTDVVARFFDELSTDDELEALED